MSNNSDRKIISWRESTSIIEYLDSKAQQYGLDRSDVLRMMVREKRQAEADSKENAALEKYRKIK
jgi:hypothetical protein